MPAPERSSDMSSAVMMERTAMAMPGMGMPAMGAPALGTPAGVPAGVNYMVVPRCTFKVEKCTGGVKITWAITSDGWISAEATPGLANSSGGGAANRDGPPKASIWDELKRSCRVAARPRGSATIPP